MKLLKILVAVVLIGAFLAVGLFIAKGPQPEIIVPGEVLYKIADSPIGAIQITNSLLTSWIVLVLIVITSIIATRSMKLIPSGIQNFVEGVIAFLVGQVEEIAGEKNGRRFFMVIATIFIWVIANNWFGLLPFFNAIGKTEDVNAHVVEVIAEQDEAGVPFAEGEGQGAWIMDNTGGMTIVKPRAAAADFEIFEGDSAGVATDRYIIFLAETFTDFERAEGVGEAAPAPAEVMEAKAALDADPKAPKLTLAPAPAEGDHGEAAPAPIPSAGLGASIENIQFPGQTLGLVIPYFRGAFSDVNNTLAMGIIAFLCIEFWGFQALGFAYIKKFINFNGINSFVGFLELLSEFIRIISFTFRLFGNIFAGEVLILMLTFLMPFLFVDVIYLLELFVGFIQASVFALLTLVFAVGAVEHHGEDDHHEGHDDAEGGAADAHHVPGAVQAH